MVDPCHGNHQPQLSEGGSVHAPVVDGVGPSQSQFPSRGRYWDSDYMPRGRFGPREAGDTFAFSAMMAGPLAYVSLVLEHQAKQLGASPEQAIGLASSTFATGFLLTFGLKVLSGFVRNYGESVIREVGAWLWSHVIVALTETIHSLIFPQRDPEEPVRRPESRPGLFPRLRRWLDYHKQRGV